MLRFLHGHVQRLFDKYVDVCLQSVHRDRSLRVLVCHYKHRIQLLLLQHFMIVIISMRSAETVSRIPGTFHMPSRHRLNGLPQKRYYGSPEEEVKAYLTVTVVLSMPAMLST